MNCEISEAHNEARLAGTLAILAVGSGTAKIQLFSTTQPAFGGGAGGTPLVEFVLNNPAGTIVDGHIVLDAENGLIMATGNPLWARWLNRNGDIVMDTDASGPSGDGFVRVSQDTLYAGGIASLTASSLG